MARLAATVSAMHVVARLESRVCISTTGEGRAKWVRGADCRRSAMFTRRLAGGPACACISDIFATLGEIAEYGRPSQRSVRVVTSVSISTCRTDLKASPPHNGGHIWYMRRRQSTHLYHSSTASVAMSWKTDSGIKANWCSNMRMTWIQSQVTNGLMILHMRFFSSCTR